MTKSTRVPTRELPKIPGYLPEYDQEYPGTYPSMTKSTRVLTRGCPKVPEYLAEYAQKYPGTYPSMTITIRCGTRVPPSFASPTKRTLAVLVFIVFIGRLFVVLLEGLGFREGSEGGWIGGRGGEAEEWAMTACQELACAVHYDVRPRSSVFVSARGGVRSNRTPVTSCRYVIIRRKRLCTRMLL